MHPSPVPGTPDAPWRYWRPGDGAAVEVGTVRGRDVALPVHFHEEDQVTMVLLGVRRFVVAGVPVEVAAGQAVRIPAGVPHLSLPSPAGVVCTNLYLPPGTPRPPADIDAGWETVTRAAALAGLSREGYSRRFKRLHGMAPQRFRLLDRLNAARALLRQGEAIAAVAADTGFADQSHLGRCFRGTFGVTPGRYRAG